MLQLFLAQTKFIQAKEEEREIKNSLTKHVSQTKNQIEMGLFDLDMADQLRYKCILAVFEVNIQAHKKLCKHIFLDLRLTCDC